MARLHWPPVKYGIDFKILLFVFKALNGLAPSYITELLSPRSTPGLSGVFPQSSISPHSRLQTKGDRAFSGVAPRLWNTLPSLIKSCPTISAFKSSLKTHLFSLAFNSVWPLLLSYLLTNLFDFSLKLFVSSSHCINPLQLVIYYSFYLGLFIPYVSICLSYVAYLFVSLVF